MTKKDRNEESVLSLTPILKLTKDAVAAMRTGAAPPSPPEGGDGDNIIPPGSFSNASSARTLVDLYYTMQEVRKRLANQATAKTRGVDSGEVNVVDFMLTQSTQLEDNAALFLESYVNSHPMWPWFSACHGIGPILAAGLVAHLGSRDLPPTVGHWWRYAGLDPTQDWMAAERLKKLWEEYTGDVEQRTRILARLVGRDPETVLRDATVDFKTGEEKKLTKASALKSLARIPFNRPLKTLCWKIGDQFVKLGSREDAFYAKFYRQRKADEILRNESGGRRELAEKTLAEKPNHAQKAIYAEGKLPDGRVDLMARRATVKLFLSHLHELWWRVEKKSLPPKPFSIGILGHGHYIPPPYQHVLFGGNEAE